jgi:chromosome segregation ATPase
MELEQLSKQVDWLDEERRKDKLRIGALEEKLTAVEGNVPPLAHQIKEQGGEITRLAALIARMDTFDNAVMQARIDAKQQFEEQEKFIRKRDEEAEKLRRSDSRAVETALAEIRKELEQFPDIKRSLKVRMDEESRLARLIDEVRTRIETMRRSEEEYTRTIRLMDDGRRQDTKRLTDLTGEAAAVRKRVDDQGGRIELSTNAIKKLETRINELSAVEVERREAISNFLDSQNLREVERERIWKEWQARFQLIESQTSDVEGALQSLDVTQRAVKRSQGAVEELSAKVERRINEITEIQRLAEERFRQEWVTFKADDQKRWTNYTLTLEEQRNETTRQHEKLAEKVVQLEDILQEIQDVLQQINEQTEKRLQSMLSMAHEWVSSYERTVGRTR